MNFLDDWNRRMHEAQALERLTKEETAATYELVGWVEEFVRAVAREKTGMGYEAKKQFDRMVESLGRWTKASDAVFEHYRGRQ